MKPFVYSVTNSVPLYTVQLKRPVVGDKWFLDEVFLKSNGVQHYLWRAVDPHGTVLDTPVLFKFNQIEVIIQPGRTRNNSLRLYAAALEQRMQEAKRS